MGAGAAVVGHFAVNVHQVQALRRRAVGLVDGVIHFLDDDGQADVQVYAARLGDGLRSS